MSEQRDSDYKCDADDQCVAAYPSRDNQAEWHHFPQYGGHVQFHPECCPRVVMEEPCQAQHPTLGAGSDRRRQGGAQ